MKVVLVHNTRVFLDLVRAGLWETEVRLKSYDNIGWKKVYQLSEEQSVVGLVAAGIEHVIGIKVPQDIVLMFVGSTIQLEQRNKAMNARRCQGTGQWHLLKLTR